MKKDIVKDLDFLSKKSSQVEKTSEAHSIIEDLLDTAAEYEFCVGLAAPQIGELKRAIIVQKPGATEFLPMINPVIIKKENKYSTTESCLSVEGEHDVERYQRVQVLYMDQNLKSKKGVFSGSLAQRVQHEIDHLNGKTILGEIE